MPDQAPVAMKPGWRTTEFYVTVFAAMSPLLTAVFHREFSGAQVQSWATVAAAVASAAYAISRAHSKQEIAKMNTAVAVANTVTPPASATSAAQTANIPIDMLAHILIRLDEISVTQRRPERERAAADTN